MWLVSRDRGFKADAPLWCNVMQVGVVYTGQQMTRTGKKPTDKDRGTTRVSVTFPAEHYDKLETLAEEKRVSIAWVVRDAVDFYLSSAQDRGPSTRGGKKQK